MKPEKKHITTTDSVENFKEFLQLHGATEIEEIQTENLVRFTVDGDKGAEQSGAYKLFMNEGNGVPSGYMNNYRTGSFEKWISQTLESTKTISPADIYKRKVAKQQEQASFKQQKAQEFQKQWDSLEKADKWHPYIKDKGIKETLFERVDVRKDVNNNLVFPITDVTGKITNLQRIWSNGNKQMEKDGILAGSFVKIEGTNAIKNFILVAEGISTAATVNEITGIETHAALTSNNLINVASAIKKHNPDKIIVITGDNDYRLTLEPEPKKNTGLVNANEAAELVGGTAVFPPFKMTELAAGKTDWNDFYQDKGFAKTRDSLRDAFRKIIDLKNVDTKEAKKESEIEL